MSVASSDSVGRPIASITEAQRAQPNQQDLISVPIDHVIKA
jgi:hypothetical protein